MEEKGGWGLRGGRGGWDLTKFSYLLKTMCIAVRKLVVDVRRELEGGEGGGDDLLGNLL